MSLLDHFHPPLLLRYPWESFYSGWATHIADALNELLPAEFLAAEHTHAGSHLLVAMNVFIHHFGSRTFAGLKIDGKALLLEKFQRFHDKWGPEHSDGYRKPSGVQAPAPGQRPGFYSVDTHGGRLHSSTPQRVSLCMIVKNEEPNLADCLSSIRDLVDEMVVLDTGSTDRTRAIAQSLGARVHELPWCDHFAAARNESIRHATGDWIFWLDADDRIDEPNREKLRQLFASQLSNPSLPCMGAVWAEDFRRPGRCADNCQASKKNRRCKTLESVAEGR